MKKYFRMPLIPIILFSFLSTIGYSQDWKVYNDTLVYFYQNDHNGDYHTLRTQELFMEESDTIIWFVDNYINVDTLGFGSYLFALKTQDKGSVFLDSIHINEDTVNFGDGTLFVNNQTIGESWVFSDELGTEITLVAESDSIIFEIDDSVRYYTMSDGRKLIQSKSFGILHYPGQSPTLAVNYTLVGIENMGGKIFNLHNLIFDFEIGDKFYYQNETWKLEGDEPVSNNYISTMAVYDKFTINGLNYYGVNCGSCSYFTYPELHPEGLEYDYPGERVEYCRTHEINSFWDDFMFEDGVKYNEVLGSKIINGTDGNPILMVGIDSINIESYNKFGSYYPGVFEYNHGLRYYYLEETGLYVGTFPDETTIIYDVGVGMSHVDYNGHEWGVTQYLIGAIKGGDTLGTYFELGTEELVYKELNVYPNPTSNILNFETPLKNISVHNNLGQMVLDQVDVSESIDLSILVNGIYIVHGEDVYGNLYKFRVVRE